MFTHSRVMSMPMAHPNTMQCTWYNRKWSLETSPLWIGYVNWILSLVLTEQHQMNVFNIIIWKMKCKFQYSTCFIWLIRPRSPRPIPSKLTWINQDKLYERIHTEQVEAAEIPHFDINIVQKTIIIIYFLTFSTKNKRKKSNSHYSHSNGI